LNNQVRVIKGAGGEVSEDQLIEILIEGLSKSIQNDPKEFYSHLVMNASIFTTADATEKYIQAYWNSI